MDEVLLSMMRSNGRNKAWAETMVNLEARKLIETANRLGSFHIQDGLTRLKFVEEIRHVIENQFMIARRAKTDEECIICVKNLREETDNLIEQDRLLKAKAAQLYAKVEFVRQNNKIVGYTLSAVHVVISGIALFTGFMMISTMTPVGMLAGAVLVTDGFNGVSQEVINNFSPAGSAHSEGIFGDAAMEGAQFLGFKPEKGLALYNAVTLTASVYSVFGVARKAGAWRLFRSMPTDFYRKVDSMSRPKLTMKIVGYGLKAKVVFDLLTMDNSSH
ncbi:DUF4225 domain-containing protein [Pantoea sp. JZ2]|uniref:DUF4225 domain-containing protein n=1 Tax=Pantoea sp. JZ2 TaxID=2654189 RepID=UPI002B4A19BC|nr:DUF4225 domain-containing protein [Pantoea sp. JZ2]WRH14251.1 DUF4225 domain-containing protein [Pantoea sp. JZ2]